MLLLLQEYTSDVIIIDDAKKSIKEVEPYMLKNPKDFKCVELPRESFKRNKAGQMPSRFGKNKRK